MKDHEDRPADLLSLGTWLSESPQALPEGEALAPEVLRIDEGEGLALVLACWRTPPDARSAWRTLSRAAESALLSELCRAPADETRAHFLRLLSFAPLHAYEPMLAQLGFDRVPHPGQWRQSMAHWRGAAARYGFPAPEEAESAWQCRLQAASSIQAKGSGVAQASELAPWYEEGLLRELRGTRWGEHPGAFYGVLRRILSDAGALRLDPKPSLEEFEKVETLLVTQDPHILRWMPPLTFQAFCDGLATLAASALGTRVEWALAEDDTPPLLRWHRASEEVFVPLGLQVLRWCIMPLRAGERAESILHWLKYQFEA